MKRIALIGAILGLLLIVDGIYMVVSQYNGGETQAWNLPDGWIVIISAAVLLVACVLAYVLSGRSSPQTATQKPVATSEVEPGQG